MKRLVILLAAIVVTACGVIEKSYRCGGITNAEMMGAQNPNFEKAWQEAKSDTARIPQKDKAFFKLLTSEVVLDVRAVALQEKQNVLIAMTFRLDTATIQSNLEMTRCRVFDSDSWSCLDWYKTDRDTSGGWMATTDSVVMEKGRLRFVSKGKLAAMKCEAHAQLSGPLKARFAWLTKW